MLVKVWVSPDPELVGFRDAALAYVREHPPSALAVHYAMISAAYPFWFNVARQTGRLLALQDQVTQTQIINRLKEQYGDRQTVSRYARSAIRSVVAWGVLRDSSEKGCYEKSAPVSVADRELALLMLEGALHATADGKSSLGLLLNTSAFFPFQLPSMTGDFVSQRSDPIEVVRYGLDEELLRLKGK